MPDLQTRVLLEMLQVAEEADVDAVALQDGDRFRPLPSVIRTASAVEIAHALLHDGHRALRDLLDALRLAVIDEPTWVALDPERRSLFDVDAPSDLDG
jgi:molybdopterin-guanine dinucleotide biosynthesis protein A